MNPTVLDVANRLVSADELREALARPSSHQVE